MAKVITRKGQVVKDPPLAEQLFNNALAGWLWLPLRLWLGWRWLASVQPKLGNPKWTETGEALQGYWLNAVKIPEQGKPAIAFDWYRTFLQALLDAEAYTWFSKLVVAGELLVGIALILGAFPGVAALAGGFMNWNFMMAGSASTNPMLFVVAVGLILAWKVAGRIGADYVLLPLLGTPWRGQSEGRAERARTVAPAPASGD